MRKNTRLFLVPVFVFSLLEVRAEEKKEAPLIPGTPYRVHDLTRPQPSVVSTQGAVKIDAPSDATVLFDGTNLDAWTTANGENPPWVIVDGVMIAKDVDIQTKEKFGAIQLHLEWRVPADRTVNGQLGGNSGCFLMNLYEIQILQSHKNEVYPDGQATALYGQRPPLVNATSPQGEWNSYDITFVPPVYDGEKVIAPAKVTVLHNGVIVQNAEEFIGPTAHKTLAFYPTTHPTADVLRLQYHNDPVEFRNIWVRPIGKIDQTK